jgi:YcaO-like protein with predicted kinase domain
MAGGKQVTSGTHRAASLARTLARAWPVARAVGVTRLADVTGLDTVGIPVCAAIRPNGRSLSTSQGKGLSLAAAQVSALMESIETWHAEHPILPRKRASVRELGHHAIDVDALPRATRARLPRSLAIDWVRGQDVAAARPLWVPVEAVTLDCVFTRPPRFDVSSNGLASGNTRDEAIVHGLCEVIERDAEARWRAGRGQRRLALDTVADPACRRLLDRFRAAGVHVTVHDLTSDVGVPVYGASVMTDPDEVRWRPLGLYQGYGCHLEPAVALARALTEAAQTRLTYIAGSRDDFFRFDYARATDEALLDEIWRELARPPRRPVDIARAPRLATPSFAGDLEVLLRALDDTGTGQVVVVALDRPEHGLPVVKVLVPGRATQVELMG